MARGASAVIPLDALEDGASTAGFIEAIPAGLVAVRR